jgi:hypothetical protein
MSNCASATSGTTFTLLMGQLDYDTVAYLQSPAGTSPVCYAAASATGTGTINACFTGGGNSCTYSVSQFVALSGAAAASAPAGVGFPQGLFNFTTSGCTAGSTQNFTITYPQPVPAGTQYWKYGPSPAGYNCSGAGCASPHWYVLPSVVNGNTISFNITDGGVGDDDLAANGGIVDQGGPGNASGGVVATPTLNQWMLALLAGLLVLVGAMTARRQ